MFLPPFVCILLWGVFSATFSMFLYKVISPQKRLQTLKQSQKEARAALIKHDGDFAELQHLITKDIGLSLKQIGLIFPAFLLTVLPVVALMFCLIVRYGYTLPNTGDQINITFYPEETTQSITWPDASSSLVINDQQGTPLFSLPLPVAIPEITRNDWLTTLFPNPLGVLPERSAVDRVHIDLPVREYSTLGASWMRGFEFWYIVSLLVMSLFIKMRFRII